MFSKLTTPSARIAFVLALCVVAALRMSSQQGLFMAMILAMLMAFGGVAVLLVWVGLKYVGHAVTGRDHTEDNVSWFGRFARLLVGLVFLLPVGYCSFWIAHQLTGDRSANGANRTHSRQIVRALEDCRRDHQRFPKTLTALVPRYLPDVPPAGHFPGDPVPNDRSARPFVYLVSEDGRRFRFSYWGAGLMPPLVVYEIDHGPMA